MKNTATATKTAADWYCPECHRWMTPLQAQRAMESGCLKGCSGVDIDYRPAMKVGLVVREA